MGEIPVEPISIDLGFTNPYRPGAGHMPPHLAGREREHAEFDQLLRQDPVLKNLILTGLRGVGKTVLLETFKPRAVAAGWHWVGTDPVRTRTMCGRECEAQPLVSFCGRRRRPLRVSATA